MSLKITLGKRPEFVAAVVKFPMPDGSEGVINAKFKYRTRREYGAFLDAHQAAVKARVDASGDLSIKERIDGAVAGNASHLADMLVGWDLDQPLTVAALDQLCDEMPAAPEAIVAAYSTAMTEGRSGN